VNHEVVWSNVAYRRLMKIWDDTYDRESIAHAIDRIQDELEVDASQKGESRPEGLRVFFAAPLAVVFWANERTTEVEIADVWIYRSPG
jgi:plasmid stabilization system protein ParE